MYSRRHSTDWRSHVNVEFKNLTIDKYSKHINVTIYNNIHKFWISIKYNDILYFL